MANRPNFVVYLSNEEKQRVRTDAANAGFPSVSDFIRSTLGLATRKSGGRYGFPHSRPAPAPPPAPVEQPVVNQNTPQGAGAGGEGEGKQLSKKQLDDDVLMDI
jgi:hypothetical protein